MMTFVKCKAVAGGASAMKILKDDGRREKQKQKRLSPLGSWRKEEEEEQVCMHRFGFLSSALPWKESHQCSDMI